MQVEGQNVGVHVGGWEAAGLVQPDIMAPHEAADMYVLVLAVPDGLDRVGVYGAGRGGLDADRVRIEIKEHNDMIGPA